MKRASLLTTVLSAPSSRGKDAGWLGTKCWLQMEAVMLLFSCSVVSDSLWSQEELQQARLSCPSLFPNTFSNSNPSSQWRHPTISSSVTLFSTCLRSFPASGSFPMRRLFTSGGHRIGTLTSASGLLMIIQHWFPLGLTDLISLMSKTLSRAFCWTRVRKRFGAQPSLWPNSHVHTWLLGKKKKKDSFNYTDLFWQNDVSSGWGCSFLFLIFLVFSSWKYVPSHMLFHFYDVPLLWSSKGCLMLVFCCWCGHHTDFFPTKS